MRSSGKRIFDRRVFERWLFGAPLLPDGARFFCNHPGKCPLAWFLMQRLGLRAPNVKEKAASWYQGLAFYEQPLPRWAHLYVAGIDAQRGACEPITLERARAVYSDMLLALRQA